MTTKEKMSASHIYDEGFVLRKEKNLSQLTNKNEDWIK